MKHIEPAIAKAVETAFKQLLSEKHLYQYVEADLSCITSAAKFLHDKAALRASDPGIRGEYYTKPLKELIAEGNEIASNLWLANEFSPGTLSFAQGKFPIHFDLPTINTFCNHCMERWPFNPVSEGSYIVQAGEQNEFFYLGYRCQQCKGDPIRFLVRREGSKLRLAGRYPFEVLPVPKVLPKAASKYYSNALIAHHAGQTLAGLFLLRVFIEQFWRTVPAVKYFVAKQPKASGDEQGSLYQNTLPPDFKSRFPSLTDVYDKLSAAIHSAEENATLFDDSCVKIEKHFEARRVFEIA